MRLSKRARQPRITINTYGDVELVWPIHMSQRHAHLMLQQHHQWVVNQLKKLECIEKKEISPPRNIVFQAVDQIWQIKYDPLQQRRMIEIEEQTCLKLYRSTDELENLRKTLHVWVKRKAKQNLSPWLKNIAEGMDVEYQSLSIRLQKKRWGSCSAAKRISLNASLLFLPKTLVEHVMIHELAHLTHLNHSAAFWAKVEKYDVDFLENRKLLRKHAKDVPAWLTETFQTH